MDSICRDRSTTTKIVIGRDIWFGICREPIQFYGALLFVTQQQET